MTGWLLAIDTSTDALSCAAGREGKVAFAAWQRRRRGHAEELAPLIQRTLRSCAIEPDALSAIAVTIGPGTFTGVRIGLAAARGMRVALKIPVVGVNTLELMAMQAARRWPGRPVLAALDARRGQVYAQYFRGVDDGRLEPWSAPAAMSSAQAARMLNTGSVLCGSGASLVAGDASAELELVRTELLPDARAILPMLEASGLPGRNTLPPSPIYLRAPDAVPAKRLLNL